jgi:prepilin-type N-terminal cleavage/methylation domain-containing protein
LKKPAKYFLSERGYNLPEVLVVAAIIGVLATIPIASMRRAKEKTNEMQAIASLNVMAVAYESYNNESRPHRYPHYLQNGAIIDNLIEYRNAEGIWQDLIRKGFVPKRYSGHPHSEPDLFAPGFRLSILPFGATPSFSASPRFNYAIALVPHEMSDQRRAIAIFQGYNDGWYRVSARARKIPGNGDFSGAKFYTWRDF